MMVNGLSHVWGQLDEIKKTLADYMVADDANNTFHPETPNSNDPPMKHEE